MPELPGLRRRHLLCVRGLWQDDVGARHCSQEAACRCVGPYPRIPQHQSHTCNRAEEGPEDMFCVLRVWFVAVQAMPRERLRGAIVTRDDAAVMTQ